MKPHILDRNAKLKARYRHNRAAGKKMDDAVTEVTEWHNRKNPFNRLAVETIRKAIFSPEEKLVA